MPYSVMAASFDCSKASSAMEKTICGDAGLSLQDEELAKTYHNAARQLDKENREKLILTQKTWLKALGKYCQYFSSTGEKSNYKNCLGREYATRIEALKAVEKSTKLDESVYFYPSLNEPITSKTDFYRKLEALQKRTNIPVLVPDINLILAGDIKKGAYFLGMKASPDSYAIEFSADEDCKSGEECSYATIESNKHISASPPFSDMESVSVILNNQEIAKIYENTACGLTASCVVTYLDWKHNGYYYNIMIRGGGIERQVAVANSMIEYEENNHAK